MLFEHAQKPKTSMNALNNSRILVIGGAGFVGSHIVDQLLDESPKEVIILDNFVRGTRANIEQALRDPRVRLVEGSITDVELVRKTMQGVDYVFLLAALWLWECVNTPRAAIEVNIVGTWNVIEATLEAKVKKIVYSSSASVYGDAVFTPMTEDHPFNNRTTYGATKIAGEQLFRAMYQQYQLNYVGLRYMNVYGTRMDYKGTYVSVIMKVIDKIQAGECPVIFGDGSQSYDFIYVTDVARANILAMKSDAVDVNLNVGMGRKTSINELVQILLKEMNATLEIDYRPQEAMFVTHRIGSTELAEKLIGFRAQVTLEEGVRRLVDWRQGKRQLATEDAK